MHDASASPPTLTPTRRRVFEALRDEGRPLGAYDIIERLTGEGRRLSPISVYRSLDYLTENGYVHRLASRSAFVACAHAHADAQPIVFLICDACGRTAEATSAAVGDALAVLASRASFTIRAQIIEVAGRCAACAA